MLALPKPLYNQAYCQERDGKRKPRQVKSPPAQIIPEPAQADQKQEYSEQQFSKPSTVYSAVTTTAFSAVAIALFFLHHSSFPRHFPSLLFSKTIRASLLVDRV
jgi:hypothetical protein